MACNCTDSILSNCSNEDLLALAGIISSLGCGPLGTNLTYMPAPTNGTILSSTGTPAFVSLANAINAGLLSPALYTKLVNLTPGGGSVSGTGTANTIPIWLNPTTLGDSIVTQVASKLFINSAPNTGAPTDLSLVRDPGTGEIKTVAQGAVAERTQIVITTAVSISTATLSTDTPVLPQQNKNVIIDNGASNINFTCDGNITASYLKHGIGIITFVRGTGRELWYEGANVASVIMNGLRGSTANLTTVNGTSIDYLAVTNY